MRRKYDIIIIGAGLYGLYSALFSAESGKRVLVLEKDFESFSRATYVNQARVHMGYHYPRSISTAIKSRDYFDRFIRDYRFCILSEFEQIYATSAKFSWTDRKSFVKFCNDASIFCESVDPDKYFKKGMCDGAYLTKEYAFDAMLLKEYFSGKLSNYKNAEIKFNESVKEIEQKGNSYIVNTSSGNKYETEFLINTTYASCNEIISLTNFEPVKIKYELCEIIICDINERLKNTGITVMDGPFFSIMPFGKTGMHSLTSVTFTPHKTSYDTLPSFECQQKTFGECTPENLSNCDGCIYRPDTAYPYMSYLAKKYLLDKYNFSYMKSLFSIKPIMLSSEVDDSRPTVIKVHSKDPTFISVLSGKINTVYDLDKILEGDVDG